MEYLLIILLILPSIFLINRYINQKSDKRDKAKLDAFITNGFPVFSETEQLEMIYNGNFFLLHERLQIAPIPTKYFDYIFTVTKQDLVNYIKLNKNILNDKSITLNQLDGFWTLKKENDFLYYYRERGQIQYTQKLSNIDELINRFAEDMICIIPKYSDNKLESIIIKG
ncbi:hypothetical protein [Mangrovimonas xylaniphaga]|uniref:hypothetical protein n=1 Tax=Mangrovimonas xylaniphaga TaxID=1645915 RepID=UPI0006B4645A|nr:hypothetical protein [Mangrovimonas xylaniphaga]